MLLGDMFGAKTQIFLFFFFSGKKLHKKRYSAPLFAHAHDAALK
jgi:hypothetical protein